MNKIIGNNITIDNWNTSQNGGIFEAYRTLYYLDGMFAGFNPFPAPDGSDILKRKIILRYEDDNVEVELSERFSVNGTPDNLNIYNFEVRNRKVKINGSNPEELNKLVELVKEIKFVFPFKGSGDRSFWAFERVIEILKGME